MKKQTFSFMLYVLLMVSAISHLRAQIGAAGTIRAEFNGTVVETTPFSINDETLSVNNSSDCDEPIEWLGNFFSGEDIITPFEVEANLLFDDVSIASKPITGHFLGPFDALPIVFAGQPIPAIAGEYKIQYRYRKRYKAKIFGVTRFLWWEEWEEKDSKAIIVIDAKVDQVFPATVPLNVCNNDLSSADFDLSACRYNEVEIRIDPPGGPEQSIVYDATPDYTQGFFFGGLVSLNFAQAAADMGITLSPGNQYQVNVCPRVVSGGVVLDEDCSSHTVNFNCCENAPSAGYYITPIGDRCAGKVFSIAVQNAEPGVTYSFSTSVPGMVITQLIGNPTTASVSTNVFTTPPGNAAITITATNCSGSQSKVDFVEIIDPNSNECSIFERLADAQHHFQPKLSPNPMTGKATLAFDLPEAQQVELMLLNTVGQIVATPLSEERRQAGPQQIVIKRANLSAGLYFYQLKLGNEVFTGKIVIED
ncbi:MAG: T9SS type A sorting domain-containing protein [Bacteroidota bacterium]